MVRKAVFPVAGLGTRFLPATKAHPKEMMPIVDKPLIQYAVEEAINAGITELIFVTNSSKRAIEDHFDSNFELEAHLRTLDKKMLLKSIQDIIPRGVTCIYIRQAQPRGLGDAIFCAKPLIENEPFAVILADDLIKPSQNVGCLSEMIALYQKLQSPVLACEPVANNQTQLYGILQCEARQPQHLGRLVTHLVEKPKSVKDAQPLGIIGRYILTPDIFEKLASLDKKQAEIQLTDALSLLMSDRPVFAYELIGKRYDCGDKLGYLKAIVEFGLSHPELSKTFSEYLDGIGH